MPEPAASPRLIKFVRRALREQPDRTFDELLERWRALGHGAADDDAIVRNVYDQQLAAPAAPPEPSQNRLVIASSLIWILANIGLVLVLGLPGYIGCQQSGQTTSGFGGCGVDLGLTFLGVGIAQLAYGIVASVIAYRFRKAVAQGILIGMGAAVVLFTVLCFGAAVKT
jgi:hypothetical protein